jgi:predicted DNA-binding transcriptional regulator AlpA
MMLERSRSAIAEHATDPDSVNSERPEVMFLDELSAVLRVSRSTIERRRREGTFPIPELNPLDRRPRWSRQAVDRYLASGPRPLRSRRGRPRSRVY